MDISVLLQVFVRSGITQMAKAAVDSFINYLKSDNYDFCNERCEEIISEYLKKSYENNAKMNTIVFRGEAKTIFDLYIPLTIKSRSRENKEEMVIDEDITAKIEQYKKIMIVDSAGMGKSTLAKYISVQSIIKNCYIPIIIELRKLSKEKGLWEYLCEIFDMIDQNMEYNDIRNLIKRGGFLVIFDGYDEVVEDLRSDVITQIVEFTNKADQNSYILTSREEEDLCSFGDFCEFKIKPLKLDESFELINKYGNNGDRAKKLINVIKQERKNFVVLKEFLVNPLLVSLLYKTFEYKEEIPYKKIEFYRQVYEALFNDHDKSKDAYIRPKRCGLEIREFECVLRYLAFFSMQKWRVEYDSIQDLLKDVKDAIENAPGIENVRAEDFVHDLLHNVSLFQKEGSAYRWAHKSFMEYFAAQCIYLEMGAEVKEILLSNMSKNDKGAKYYNILDFYYDMDLKSIRKYIIKPFLENYVRQYKEFKEKIYQEGLGVSKELIDIAASTDFFLEYKIMSLEANKDIGQGDSEFEPFEYMQNKYGPGNMVFNRVTSIMAHTNIKQNIYLPKLLNEKYVDLFGKQPRGYISEKDTGISKIGEEEYIDNLVDLVNLDLLEDEIEKIYEFLNSTRNTVYCLDGEKCRLELNKINSEIKKEMHMNSDRFMQLEY